MSAKDFLRRKKTRIQSTLTGNRQLIVDKCYEEGIITEADHINLSSINKGTETDYVTMLINNIRGKGEKRCKEFLDFLQKDEDILEALPQLKDILLEYTASLPNPVPESSSTAKKDDVRPDTKPKPEKDVPYPLNSNPTGLCFIINNVDFNDNKPRLGSDADAERLAEVFSWLGFRVLMSKNQTKDQMDQLLKCLSSASDFSKLVDFKVKEWSEGTFTDLQKDPAHGDAFICCILSHGNTGVVCGTDWKRLEIKDIKKMFKATELSPLTNKPKVFLIQACQGGETHGRVVLPDVDFRPPSIFEEADFLVGMSTVEDYEAFRDPVHGSWYIQTVCKQMKERCPSGVDMCTILEYVTKEITWKVRGTMMQQRMKQMPEIQSTLTKNLVFSPHSKFSMSAVDTLKHNKTAIEESLSEDEELFSIKRHRKNLTTVCEHGGIESINKDSSYRTVTEAVKTRKEASSADNRDYVAPERDRQKQELKKRITNLCLTMNNPTEGSVRHGSARDAGHFFEGVEKIFPLKNPLGSKWILGGVGDTIYKGKDAEVNGWGKFYLPEEVKMTVIGVIDGTSCPNEQLVLMFCEDGALYAYDGEELHAVASNVDQLLDEGIEYPAAKSYYKGEAFKDMTKEEWAEVRKGAVGQRLEEEHRKLVTANKSNILKILKSTKQHKAERLMTS